MNWSKYPFLRLLLSLSTGILVYEVVGGLPLSSWMILVILPLLLGVEILLNRWIHSYQFRWIFGVYNILVFAYVGYACACLKEVNRDARHYSQVSNPLGAYLARIHDPPTEKENSIKVVLELLGSQTDTIPTLVSGKVLAYVQKSETAKSLRYGDVLALVAPIEEVPPPANPEEFDYRRFLERKGITGRVYLKEGNWLLTGARQANPLFAFAYRFRDRLLGILRCHGITEEEFGVGAAILLGYDDSLPPQVRQQYVAAGAMHVLCVSGMHVGIIYLLASFVLGFWGKQKRMVRIRRIFLLALIWFYALLTGLSPSILRSTLMITFVVFGELIRRKGFTVNSIAASAFVLLLLDPNTLFAMGFQLSYVAVLGIVLLQKPINNLLFVNNIVVDKIWEITAVSLAAQLSTMPFTVYYFHQFTPYFWLSNLFLTPMSFVVILSGMVFLLLSWIPWINGLMGKLLRLCLHWMNQGVPWVEQLPFSIVKGQYINKVCFALSLALLLLFLLFVTIKRKRMLMEMLVLGVMLALAMAWQTFRCAHQNMMIVYSLRNHTAISFVSGFSSVMLCDASLLEDPSAINYSLKGSWSKAQLSMNPPCYTLNEDVSNDLVFKRKHLVSFHGELFAFWDSSRTAVRGCEPLPVDYLMVRERQKPELNRILEKYRLGLLLIDGSVPGYLALEWKRQAQSKGISYVDLKEGCYVREYR